MVMRYHNLYSTKRCLPRMSWNPKNLYNIWQLSFGPQKNAVNFARSRETLFKQRWRAKALVRAYHGDLISENVFKRWYLPGTLPDVRPQQSAALTGLGAVKDEASLLQFAGRDVDPDRAARGGRRNKDEARTVGEEGGQAGVIGKAQEEVPPVGSLMFQEVERRLDVFIFRCCFAESVYEARRYIIHGDVLLNGKKHTNANTRLAPGDMVTVDPKAIRFLYPSKNGPISDAVAEAEVETSEENATSDGAPSISDAAAGQEPSSTEAATPAEPSSSRPKKISKGKEEPKLTPFALPAYASPFIFIPAYIEVSFATCSAVYVRHPSARVGYSEIPTPFDADGDLIRLAWEWYKARRPRIRSKRKLEAMPDNRRELPLHKRFPELKLAES